MIDVCPDDNSTMLSSRRVKVDGALEWVAWCWHCRHAWLDDGRHGIVEDPAGTLTVDAGAGLGEHLGPPLE